MKEKNKYLNAQFIFSLVLITIILLATIFAQWIVPYSPFATDMTQSLQSPSAEHWFGTDRLGRDLLSRVIWGARVSIPIALGLVAAVTILGTTLGMIAGFAGGWVDKIIMRISEIVISIPEVVLAIAIAGILGTGMEYIAIALVSIMWSKYAKLARNLVVTLKKNDYVSAAKVAGMSQVKIIWKYIRPNMMSIIVITGVMNIGTVMLVMSGLSFLGFGAQPPIPEWGSMLNEGRQFFQSQPSLMVFPGLAILIVVISFNLLGDALRDIWDVRQD